MKVLITSNQTGTNYRIGDVVEVGEVNQWGDYPIVDREAPWGTLFLTPNWFMEVPDSVPCHPTLN